MNYTYLESATTTKKTQKTKKKQTNKQTNKKEQKQNRFIGQRSYAYHTHIPTTNTHTHACIGGVTKKG